MLHILRKTINLYYRKLRMLSAQPMGSDEFFQKNGIVSPTRHKMQKYEADYHTR